MAKKTEAGRASISFKAQAKKKLSGAPSEPAPTPRMKTHYYEYVVPKLKEQFGYTSIMQVPRITKIVVSMGVGDAHENPRKLNTFLDEIELVTGQRPQVTRARVSVANFKLREGMAVGLRVTLRKARMYEFLDRLLALVIPRLRDFRGLSPKSFDRRGNYNFGLPDQLAFPELRADTVDFQNGMNLAVATTARTDDEARELLRLMGFPFKNHPVQLIGVEG
ncbi:MAG: 50S ribosomal protein L5 [Planctomycetes bacterium]|nr:50S ribosomal protein L5 [Planctomycetota bacterium]